MSYKLLSGALAVGHLPERGGEGGEVVACRAPLHPREWEMGGGKGRRKGKTKGNRERKKEKIGGEKGNQREKEKKKGGEEKKGRGNEGKLEI